MNIDPSLRERYSRQLLFQPIGPAGQIKLLKSRVLIVGMGALGTVLSEQMVRAGVGFVRIVDRDYVERSNLQRQMLYDEEDANHAYPKAIAAVKKLRAINSDIRIEAIVADVTPYNAETLIEDVDLVLDGTDNFQTRLLINDACFKAKVPFVYGGAVRSQGMSAMFIPSMTCCLRCVIANSEGEAETCDTVGVISPIATIIASFQAVEALKYLVADFTNLSNQLLTINVWPYQLYEIALPESQLNCPTCGTNEYPALELNAHQTTTICGRETVQIQSNRTFDLAEWEKKLFASCRVFSNPFLLKAVTPEGETIVLFSDGRALIQGTDDITRARTVYDRYIGS